LERAYSLEAMVDELGFVIGPMLVVPLCLQVHPTAGIIASMIFTGIGTLMLIRMPTGRGAAKVSTVIKSDDHKKGKSVVAIPAVQMIIASLVCMGILFGAIEIAIVAFTEHLGQPNAASYIAATFAMGSFLGAI